MTRDEYGICSCKRSEVKTGGPTISPLPTKFPNCPECGEPWRVVGDISVVRREVMVYTIEKCLWWPQHFKNGTIYNESARRTGEEIEIHLLAGLARVSRGEPFDAHSEAVEVTSKCHAMLDGKPCVKRKPHTTHDWRAEARDV